MKLKLLLIVFYMVVFCGNSWGILEGGINSIDPPKLRGEKIMTISQGALFKAILQETISTETHTKYDTIKAIIPTNFYTMEAICIPKSSIFEGEISRLELPKKGRHALFSVNFDKITTPEGKVIPIKASLWVKSSNQIGGGPSEMGELRVVPFRVGGLSNIGYLSVRKSGEYLEGKNISILAGTEILIKLDEKLNIKL